MIDVDFGDRKKRGRRLTARASGPMEVRRDTAQPCRGVSANKDHPSCIMPSWWMKTHDRPKKPYRETNLFRQESKRSMTGSKPENTKKAPTAVGCYPAVDQSLVDKANFPYKNKKGENIRHTVQQEAKQLSKGTDQPTN